MMMYGDIINTRDLPSTYSILKKNLPQILIAKCFNDAKLPFSVELRRTEIGHLFEHILLEYLCEQKFTKGFDYAEYSGETHWNWIKEPKGVFHITISSGYDDVDIFPKAVEQTTHLFQLIMNKIPSLSLPQTYLPSRESQYLMEK